MPFVEGIWSRMIRTRWARMTWLDDYRSDVARCQKTGHSAVRAVLSNQGLWALLHYRLAHALSDSSLSPALKRPLLAGAIASRRVVETVTQARLPHEATIGPGLLMPHLGGVVMNSGVIVGAGCTIYRGVTLGVSGQGERRGVPVIDDNVVIYPNATVAGRIRVERRAIIAANSLVLNDVPRGCLARGVPAVVLPDTRRRGSDAPITDRQRLSR